MRIFGVVTVIAVLIAGPALAQQKPVPRYGETDKEKSQSDIAAEKEAERAYQRSLGNIPEQTKSTDPWGAVRSDNAPKAAAKTPAPKPKTKTEAKVDAKADGAAKQ
jgi:hypothetical protein